MLNLRNLWFTSDFPTGTESMAPSSFNVSPAVPALILQFPPGLLKAVQTLWFFRYNEYTPLLLNCCIYSLVDVGCFTVHLSIYRIPHFFKIRTFSRFISATWASIIFSRSTICAPSFKHTTKYFFFAIPFLHPYQKRVDD